MFHTPAHKQTDPAKQGAQIVNATPAARIVMGYDVVQRASEKAANFRDCAERDADNVKAQELRDALADQPVWASHLGGGSAGY